MVRLDYANAYTLFRRSGLALICIILAILCGVIAVWCWFHMVKMNAAMAQAGNTWCGTCYQLQMARVKKMGMPPENAMALGFLSSGCAVVAMIQSLRCYNAGRKSPRLREASASAERDLRFALSR